MITKILSLKNLSGLLLILIAGCATQNPSGFWYNSNKTAEQEREDMAECRNEARLGTPPMYTATTGEAIVNGMVQGNRANAIFTDCMISKGYSLVSTNSLVANPCYGAQYFSSDPKSPYYEKRIVPELPKGQDGIWLSGQGVPLPAALSVKLNAMTPDQQRIYTQIPFVLK